MLPVPAEGGARRAEHHGRFPYCEVGTCGSAGAVVAGGVGAIIVTGVWALRFPELRRADRFEAQQARDLPAAPAA